MESTAARNALIRSGMPRTAQRVQQLRAELGEAWVNQCIRRGMDGEPGWFWAWEKGVSIGMHWGDPAVPFVPDLPRMQQAVLLFRPKEAA